MATLNSHGLEPIEEAILDAWDEGLSREEIARRLDINPRRVKNAIDNFSEGKPDRWHLGVRPATDALLAAIARAHPEMVAG